MIRNIIQVFECYSPDDLRREAIENVLFDFGWAMIEIGRPRDGWRLLLRSRRAMTQPREFARRLRAHKGAMVTWMLPDRMLAALRRWKARRR